MVLSCGRRAYFSIYFFLTAFGFAAFRRRAGVEPRSGFSTVRTSRPRQVSTSLVLMVSSEAISFTSTI